MARIPASEFERALRRELVRHEDRRRARLGDPAALAASEALFVREVMRAAGYAIEEQSEEDAQAIRRGRRAARVNEDAAFGEMSA